MELTTTRPSPGPGTDELFHLRQRIRYGYTGPVRDLRQRLVVLPAQAGDVTLRVSQPHRAQWSTDAWGNTVVDVHVPRIDASVEFLVSAQARARPRSTTQLPTARWLAPTALTTADEPISWLARPVADAAAICARVHAAMSYRFGVTGVRTTAAAALLGGVGVCQDYAHVMIAACRQAGIPARYVSGHLVGEGGSHAWVETLERGPDGTWRCRAWDPTHDRPAEHGYLTVAVGRDHAEVAPVSGTFRGPGVRSRLTSTKQLRLC